MRSGRVSATAKVIAASTILLASDRRTAGLVAPGAAALCRPLLSSTLGDRMLAGSAGNPLVRPLWRWLERCLLPGIMAHYWRRKRWIEEQTRVALAGGFVRVIVLGAGFDTLAYRLARELPHVEFIEVDHAATQAAKHEGLASAVPAAPANIKFVAADLEQDPIPQSLANDARPTIVIAEGLLMYLRAEHVDRLLASLWQLSAGPVRLVFNTSCDGLMAHRGSVRPARGSTAGWHGGANPSRGCWSRDRSATFWLGINSLWWKWRHRRNSVQQAQWTTLGFV